MNTATTTNKELTLLRMGAKLAAQRRQDMKWQHVLSAHAALRALENQKC